MLSVAQSAEVLRISPARVRALIKAGRLPAVKVGRAWCLREEDVLQRLSEHPRRGRPRTRTDSDGASAEAMRPYGGAKPAAPSRSEVAPERAHELYLACGELFQRVPDGELMGAAQSREEASFYMAVADFFLQQQQDRLVAEGVY